jgi:hypothetical protein
VADQLATRAAGRSSYGHIIPVPEDEPEDVTDYTMEDEDATQTEDWIDPEHPPPTSVPVFNVGLAAEEERDQQLELLHGFGPSPV